MIDWNANFKEYFLAALSNIILKIISNPPVFSGLAYTPFYKSEHKTRNLERKIDRYVKQGRQLLDIEEFCSWISLIIYTVISKETHGEQIYCLEHIYM